MEPFIAAYKDVLLANYANFSGRLSRGAYWRWVAVNIVVFIVLAILAQISSIFLILYFVYALATLVPSIASAIRRLHDIDKPGVMVLIALIPCVGLVLLYFLAQPGTAGPNQYGPQPA